MQARKTGKRVTLNIFGIALEVRYPMGTQRLHCFTTNQENFPESEQRTEFKKVLY